MQHVASRRSSGVSTEFAKIQTCYERGEYCKARFQAQKALKSKPNHVGLHALAGFSAQKLGETSSADALLTKAVQLAKDSDDSPLDLPTALMQAGRWQMAVPLFVSQLKKNPSDAAALNRLGRCLLEIGEVEKAISLLGDALKYAPSRPNYASDLGDAFLASGQDLVALECFEIARKLAPTELPFVVRSIKHMYLLDQYGQGLALLEDALKWWPKNPALVSNYASYLNAMGRPEEALTQWRRVMDLDPSYSIAYLNFANSQPPSAIADFEKRLDKQIAKAASDEDEMRFRFAKVAAREDSGDFDAAYSELMQANAIRHATTPFDIEAEARAVDCIKSQFLRPSEIEVVENDDDVTPIFILGMPRAGSSLTETIIGRHSDVLQRGELDYLGILVKRLGGLGAPLLADQAQALRDAYLSRLSPTNAQAPFVTDKMPQNFRLIGHIATAMPSARIVHVHRDPRACCWSNFRHFFVSDSLGFTNDVESLIRYYELYQDLMAFWHDRFPGRIIDVDYEQLVENPGQHIPGMIGKLGLEWQEACLAPQDSAQIVRTASQAQVRKKIYKGSAQGWRKYEARAGEWLNRLPDRWST